MSRTISTTNDTELDSSSLMPLIFFEGEFDSTVRLWSGYGDLTWGGNTWSGVANLGNISSIQETSEIRAVGITVELSGIPSAVLALVLNQLRWGRTGKLYLGFADTSSGNLELIDDPTLVFSGKIDIATIDESGESSTIQVSLESRLIDLERPRVSRYTNEEQLKRFSGDVALEFIHGIADKTVKWKG